MFVKSKKEYRYWHQSSPFCRSTVRCIAEFDVEPTIRLQLQKYFEIYYLKNAHVGKLDESPY